MDINKTISNSAWPVLYLVAGLLFLSFYPFYPSTYFYGFFLILLLFGAISFVRPVIAGSLMIAGGSLFGNHPGGRFLELFDLALLLCLAGLLRPVPPKMRHREANDTAKHTAGTGHSAIGVKAVDLILPGVLLITILSYSGAFYLLEAFEGYKVWPFHFMTAQEWLPHYSIRVSISGILCAWFAMVFVPRARQRDSEFAGMMLMMALMLPICVGFLDAWLPPVARALDAFHIYLDGYVDRSPSHLLTDFRLPGASDVAPNSLFWNRSWLMVYCTAGIPVFGLGLALLNRPRLNALLGATMGSFYFLLALLAGARAPFLGFLVFVIGFASLGFSRIRHSKFPAVIAFTIALGAVALPVISYTSWAVPLLGERWALYRNGVAIWQAFPVFGGGLESFGFWNDALLRPADFAPTLESSHNLILQILSGTGIVGLLFFAILVFLAIRSALLQSSKASSVVPAAITFGGLLAVLVHSSFQEWWYLRPVQLQFWLALIGPLLLWQPADPRFTNLSWLNAPRRWSRRSIYIIASLSLIALITLSMWRGYNIKDRFNFQENVGHREKRNGSWTLPLLEGDGQFYTREDGETKKHQFQCSAPRPSITGIVDARKICEFRPLPETSPP